MKKYIVLFICVSFIFMLSCGSPADTDTTANTPANNGNAEESVPSNENIFGAISEIVGNMATINLAVMPESGMPVPMNRPAFDRNNIPDGVIMGEDGQISLDPDNLPDGVMINDDGSMSVNRGGMGESGDTFTFGSGSMTFGEGMPEGFDPENMPEGFMSRRADGEGGFSRGAGAMGGMLLDYTGEEKEFIIPVGLPIYALVRDADGVETETEIELGDIQAGNAISVTYKADGKTVDKIIISQITAMSPSETEEMRERISEFNINNTDNNAEDGGN